jgi:hypothetical protein
MTRREYIRLAAGTLWTLNQAQGNHKEELVVIGHPSNRFDSLSCAKVGNVFLRKVSRWPWGAEVAPADFPMGAPIRKEFVQLVLKISEEQLAAYWIDQRATRGVSPPVEVRDAAAAKLWVAERPGGIAYIPVSALDGTVKPIRLEP